jgi:ATP-dependent Clp protease ATP-binding subunit ClpA
MALKGKWGDQFVSVEHLVLAMADDSRFGEQLYKQEGLTKAKMEEAVKEVWRQEVVSNYPVKHSLMEHIFGGHHPLQHSLPRQLFLRGTGGVRVEGECMAA